MNKKERIDASVEHWEEMIKWVKEQPKVDVVSSMLMMREIGVAWGSRDCSLCSPFNELDFGGECPDCPLEEKYGNCCDKDEEGEESTENAWNQVDEAETWDEWLQHAKVMLEQLESL